MRRRMIAHRRMALSRIDARLDDRVLLHHRRHGVDAMDIQALHRRIGARTTSAILLPSCIEQDALIADLSAGFRVERRHVEHDFAVDAGRQFVHLFVILRERDDVPRSARSVS